MHGFLVHYNLSQYIVYKIYKYLILQYWVDQEITHMADWEEIDLSPFEGAQDKTTFHKSHFIKKFISKTLSNMTIK